MTAIGVFETANVGAVANVVQGPNSSLYYVGNQPGNSAGSIHVLSPTGPKASIPLNATAPNVTYSLAAGSDGNFWILGGKSPSSGGGLSAPLVIAKVTPAGVITTFSFADVDDSTQPVTFPQITPGPDGALWFTTGVTGKYIGRISTSGTVTKFPLPAGVDAANAITAGPDGNLWFTTDNQIGRITPAGTFTAFALPSQAITAGLVPRSIVSGPGGALWFTDNNQIGKITTAGAITMFPTSIAGTADQITVGPDGALYFTVAPGTPPAPTGYVTTVGRLDPTSGAVSQVNLPFVATGIVSGPNNNLYAVGQDLSILIPNASDTGVPGLTIKTVNGLQDVTPINNATTLFALLATFRSPTGGNLPASDFYSPGNTIVADGQGGYKVYGPVNPIPGPFQVSVYQEAASGRAAVATGGGMVTGATQTLFSGPVLFGIQTGNEGANASGTAGVSVGASVSTPVSGTVSGTIDWGDGSAPTTNIPIIITTVGGPNGQISSYRYSFGLTHAYPKTPGAYVAHATLSGSGGGSIDVTGLIVVNAAALTARQAQPISINLPAPLGVDLAYFNDPSGADIPARATYAATIDWGDGSGTSAGTLVNSTPNNLNQGLAYAIQGTHAYVKPGTYKVNVTITQGGLASTTVQSTVTVAFDPALARFVNHAFSQLIGNPADPASIDTWVGQLQTGAITRTNMAFVYESTPKALSDRVIALFQQVEGIMPDPGTISQVSQSFANGLTDESAASFLYASTTFSQQTGGTDAGFLKALYLKALGRPIDSGALAGYQQLLASGQMTRTQVAYKTLTSSEYRARLVNIEYQTYLGRDATNPEQSAGITQLANGTTDQQFIAALVGSTEYLNKP